jgi:hypothetical protein
MTDTYEDIKQRYKSGPIPNGRDDDDIICRNFEPHPIASIPPRRWAYGTFLLFGEASVLGAVDGGGKGGHAVVIALSMITGRQLLGEHVWRSGPVAIITYEDKEDEWRRRIAAACLHYKINYEEAIPHFHFISHKHGRIRFAARSEEGRTLFPHSEPIIQHLKRIGAVLLIVDPFNHAHALEDGNNNTLIAQVAGEATRIAEVSDTALLALHHLRKGSTGDIDDLMGATSLRATFRSTRILRRMTPEQAEKLQIPAADAWRYSCIAGTKDNYAPPARRAAWYRLESVGLANRDDLYIEGDNVAVITTWAPPSPFAGIRLDVIERVFEAIRHGPGNGERFSPDVRAEHWVGLPITEITGKPVGIVSGIIDGWIDTTVLTKEPFRSPKLRRVRASVTLNEAKVAEILAPLGARPEPAE